MSNNPYHPPAANLERAEEAPARRAQMIRRTGAAVAVVAVGLAAVSYWWFFGFTRFYFRAAPAGGLIVELAIYAAVFAYGLGMAIRGTLAPWKAAR